MSSIKSITTLKFSLTRDRLTACDKGKFIGNDNDFIAQNVKIGPDEVKILEKNFSGKFDFKYSDNMILMHVKDKYLDDCVNHYHYDKDYDDGFLSDYLKIRAAALFGYGSPSDSFTGETYRNQYARAIALNSVPRAIYGETFKIELSGRLPMKKLAELFYKYDSTRENDGEIYRKLIETLL